LALEAGGVFLGALSLLPKVRAIHRHPLRLVPLPVSTRACPCRGARPRGLRLAGHVTWFGPRVRMRRLCGAQSCGHAEDHQ
jgi:hypothetical protein